MTRSSSFATRRYSIGPRKRVYVKIMDFSHLQGIYQTNIKKYIKNRIKFFKNCFKKVFHKGN